MAKRCPAASPLSRCAAMTASRSATLPSRACATRDCDIVVFLDGDGSDRPELIPQLLAPILDGTHDFVIGSRTRGQREPGSMNALQIAAGYIAGSLTRLLYGVAYTDMCAFR